MTEFKPGDEVYGTCDGSFAEYVVTQAGLLARKPAHLSFEQAAAIPVSGVTALQGVRDRADVQPGEKVLIIGASGGVGTFAVQIAKALGAEVTGVCSSPEMDLVGTSAPITSLTTPATISPAASSATTPSWTSAATAGCPTSVRLSLLVDGSSSSEARQRDGGWEASTASFGR